jgi:hypothetical protein
MKIARYAQERNALVGIGKDALLTIRSIDTIAIEKAGKELVDGAGLSRICDIIKMLG